LPLAASGTAAGIAMSEFGTPGTSSRPVVSGIDTRS